MPRDQFSCPHCQDQTRINFLLEDGTIFTTAIGTLVAECCCGYKWMIPAGENVSQAVN